MKVITFLLMVSTSLVIGDFFGRYVVLKEFKKTHDCKRVEVIWYRWDFDCTLKAELDKSKEE